MLARVDRCRRNSLLWALSWGFPLFVGCGASSHAGEPARGGSGNGAGEVAADGGRGGAGSGGGAPLAQGGQSTGPVGSAGADDAPAGAPGAGEGGEAARHLKSVQRAHTVR